MELMLPTRTRKKKLFLSRSLFQRILTRGISSNGRALALHARGTGIDTRILHYADVI
jgi:hypothetical protein